MSIQYKQKKIMTLLAQKNTVFFVAFTLLLLFYVITMFQANATAKHQLNFIFIFCFIQTILAHLLTSSELLSGIRSGFDKLLFSYSWGIRKIVLYNFLYTFIYQLIIAITAFFLSIAYDFFVNDLHTFNSLIGFNNGIHGKFIVNLLCNMFIVLLIHFAFVLRIKNHIGNIIGTSVLLLLLATGVFANQVMPAHSLLLIFTDFFGVKLIFWEDIFWQFLSNRFFILTICILFFHFSLLHYAKNSSTAYFFTQKTFKRITYLF
jgi:hypothetical protein